MNNKKDLYTLITDFFKGNVPESGFEYYVKDILGMEYNRRIRYKAELLNKLVDISNKTNNSHNTHETHLTPENSLNLLNNIGQGVVYKASGLNGKLDLETGGYIENPLYFYCLLGHTIYLDKGMLYIKETYGRNILNASPFYDISLNSNLSLELISGDKQHLDTVDKLLTYSELAIGRVLKGTDKSLIGPLVSTASDLVSLKEYLEIINPQEEELSALNKYLRETNSNIRLLNSDRYSVPDDKIEHVFIIQGSMVKEKVELSRSELYVLVKSLLSIMNN